MINKIEIISTIPDTRATVRGKKWGVPVTIVDVYSIDKKFTVSQLNEIASMLSNPAVQETSINSMKISHIFTWAIEIGFLPGVTDNVANTATELVEDLLEIKFINNEHIYTSQVTFIENPLERAEVIKIAADLYNPIIQRVAIK